MLAAASNPIIARASAWLAVAMLLVQTLPAASCDCSDSVSGDRCWGTQSTSTCCSRVNSSSCCGKSRDDRSAVGPTSGCCGGTCGCGTVPAPARNPAAPAQPEDSRQERLELVTMSPTGTIALVSTLPSASRIGVGSAALFAPATALDRCIALSRFTC